MNNATSADFILLLPADPVKREKIESAKAAMENRKFKKAYFSENNWEEKELAKK